MTGQPVSMPLQPPVWNDYGVPYAVRCHCGKLYSDTRKHARRLYRFYVSQTHHGRPVRFYVCRWGGWHWTQQLKQRRSENDTA